MQNSTIRLPIRKLPDHFDRSRITTVLDEIESALMDDGGVYVRAYADSIPGASVNGRLEQAAAAWRDGAIRGFLEGYLEAASDAPFVPRDHDQFTRWLDLYLLDKALHELEYELSHRPDWVPIPLRGVARLLRALV